MNRRSAAAAAAGLASMGLGKLGGDALKRGLNKEVRKEIRVLQTSNRSKAKNNVAGRKRAGGGVSLSGPPVINALPRLKPKIEMKSGTDNNSVRVSILDYLGPLVVPDLTPTRGLILMSQMFSPARIPGSKLTTLASMYERYVVNSLKFHYSAACPTTVGGALIMAFDKDPNDVNLSGEPGIRHAIGLSSMTQFAPWEHASMAVAKENQQNFYFTSPGLGSGNDERLEFVGSLFVIASTPGSIVAEQALGDIWVEAEVTFYDPTWEPTDVSGYVDQPTDGAHTLSLVADEGFSGTENDSTLSESNIALQVDGRQVGLAIGAVGFILPSNSRFHVMDTMVGLQTTVRITSESVTAYPLTAGHIDTHSADNSITFTANFESSDTSATQTNWAASFLVILPGSIQEVDGEHYITEWYLVSNLTGTVGGTYTGRSLSVQRDAAYSRFNDVSHSRRKVHPPKPARITGPLADAAAVHRKVDGEGKAEADVKVAKTTAPPGSSQWVKIQISSDSQQSGLSVTTDP
jgi:hypothetical protein